MPNITYEIVEHDGGWAYKVEGTFSETFPTHSEALAAAEVAAKEQEIPGHTETIEYEDDRGKWHTEMASGRDQSSTPGGKALFGRRKRIRTGSGLFCNEAENGLTRDCL